MQSDCFGSEVMRGYIAMFNTSGEQLATPWHDQHNGQDLSASR